MSSGGGTTTTTQNTVSTKELPAWLDQAAQQNIVRGQMVADLGYVPYYGVDTAGFSPMQTSGFQNTANAASAFGLGAPTDVNAYMPQTTTDNLGFTGYSSGSAYDQALKQLEANRKGQYDAMQAMFIDPQTGAASAPTILNTAKTDPVQALNMYQQRAQSGDSNYFQDAFGGGFDPANPYDSANAYNNAQKFNAWMKSQGDNPLVKTSLLLQGLNMLNNNYLNSESGMNASQGGSMLTTGTGSTGTVGQNNTYDPSYYNYSSGYDVGSGWGDSSSTGMADVQNTASSSDWGSYGSYGW